MNSNGEYYLDILFFAGFLSLQLKQILLNKIGIK